jgi:hypothetical protein
MKMLSDDYYIDNSTAKLIILYKKVGFPGNMDMIGALREFEDHWISFTSTGILGVINPRQPTNLSNPSDPNFLENVKKAVEEMVVGEWALHSNCGS